ncbi:heme-copper oxidase subunit III [Sphingobium sp.]|uniref:heme-copper oxidase subunit III n=1 Tax=Sphingobium sp. TaxID=1912891 RepID=UPI0035C6CF8B
MSLLARLTEKSWEESGEPGPITRPSAGAVGMTAYFAVAGVMFTLLGAAYLMRMGVHGALGHGGSDWRPMPDPPLLWINGAVLLASSIAWEGARRDRKGHARQASVAGAALGALFLVGQWLLWRRYLAHGYSLSANPANAFFYLLTALHGCHIIGGLVAAGRALAAHDLPNIRLCAIYWHFLLLIWIFLAALLVMT